MSDPLTDEDVTHDDKPLDPATAGIVAKVRWLMIISGVTTLVAIAAVMGVIGYRVFRSEGSAARADVTAMLPKGARVVAIAAANDRLVVTIELAGALEARTFDLKTLAPLGRLRFEAEDGGRRTDDRGQRTEDRGQRTEDRGQRTDDRGQRTEDGR